jgi:NitT/TauT family transport system substrate-binding protein
MAVRRSAKFAGFLIIGAVLIFGIKFLTQKTSVGQAVAAAAKGSAATAGSADTYKGKPVIKVCVVTWGGYAGGEYFNGGFKPSEASKYWTQYGVPVEFIKIDDASSLDAWKADKCQVHWTTVDAFTTEVGALADLQPQIFFQADWSRGGDVLVGKSSIKSIKDLTNVGGRKGKVALWRGTPSETLLLKSLEAAGLTESDVEIVSAPSAVDAAKIFRSGDVDAAAVWSPDDAALTQGADAVPGAHVLVSSKQLANAIPDAFFAKKAFIDAHPAELKALVEGWLKGAAAINTDPGAKADAVKILAAGLEQPDDFIQGAIGNVRLATYGDNQNFFALKGAYTGVTGKAIYEDMAAKYRKVGLVDGTIPDWSSVVNTSILRQVSLSGPGDAAEGQIQFAKPTESVVKAAAFAEKAVSVEFPTASSALTDDAMVKIDQEVGGIVRQFTGARVRVEGNTDNKGNAASNQALSQRRAQAVVDYLVRKYGFDPNRFISVGNGDRNPVADNGTDDGRQKNRRTDIQIITAG